MTTDKPRVEYDSISTSYDKRYRTNAIAGVGNALAELALALDARRILEVGCGTGHWLEGLRAPCRELYGLDLSAGMLGQAQEIDDLHLAQSYGARLPHAEGSFDLVYCVNAIHHFNDPRGFVAEARRLLRPGGALAVVGTDPHGRRESWYVYHYFEGTYETDLRRFPRHERVMGWMREEGFEDVTAHQVEHVHDAYRGHAVFDAHFLQKDSCSQLALLSDEAYAAGLGRLRAAIEAAEARGEEASFVSDLSLVMLAGRLPA